MTLEEALKTHTNMTGLRVVARRTETLNIFVYETSQAVDLIIYTNNKLKSRLPTNENRICQERFTSILELQFYLMINYFVPLDCNLWQ